MFANTATSTPSARTRAYVAWLNRHGKVVWAVALIVSVVAFWRTARLYMSLRTDLESLLPPNVPSVVALRELRERTHGIRFLGVLVDSGNPQNLPAAERLIDDLAERVRTYPQNMVAAVRTGISEERRFIEQHAALYADLPDLIEVRRRIEARRDYESAKAADVLLDENELPPSVDMSDIQDRYRNKDSQSNRFPNDRYSNVAEHLTMMLVEIGGYSTGSTEAKALINRIVQDVDSLGGPDRYAPGMRVAFAGDPAISLEELSALVSDLTFSTLVVIGAVMAVLLLYYRWWRAIPIIVAPLLVSAAASFAIATQPPFRVTELNSNTAFLGSIIIGNGINFAIILLARYVEARRHGSDVNESLSIAVHATRVGTVTAAAAAAIAYGSLMVTRFRGFWQFGVIGGIGMLLCWVTTFVLVPPLVAWLDRSDVTRPRPLPSKAWSIMGPVAKLVAKVPAPLFAIGIALSIVAAVGARHFGPDRFETDFSKLRRADTWKSGQGYWGRRMDTVMGRYLTPIVVLADTKEQASRIAEAIREQSRVDPVLSEVVDTVRTIEDILPADQEQKIAQARAIHQILTPKIRSLIPQNKRDLVDRLLGPDSLRPIGPEDLPLSFVVGMREKTGRLDRTVLIFPRPNGVTWRGKTLTALAHNLRSIAAQFPGPDGQAARVAGQAPLSADITASMASDGPRATSVALAGVVLLVVAAFRWSRETVLILGTLCIGVLWLAYATIVLDVRINFANFIGFPITFGIGVDYAVNVAWRHRLDGGRDVLGAVRSTGGAVGLCSITTIIGYSSLLLAKNQALFSFGVVSVIGEITCLATAVILLPAALLLMDRRPVADSTFLTQGRKAYSKERRREEG